MNEPTLALMYKRAVNEIEESLECALSYLCKYQSLMLEHPPFLDVDYEKIEFLQACFLSSVRNAHIQSSMCVSIFRGSSFSDKTNTILVWTSRFNYSTDFFRSVEEYKLLIKHVLDSLDSDTLEMPETVKLTQKEAA